MIIGAEEADQLKMSTPELSSTSTSNDDTPSSLPVRHRPAQTLMIWSFAAYRSILDRYPQLVFSTIKSSPSRFNWPIMPPALQRQFDPERMSSIILTRRMQMDPSAVICGAESAGGSCADSACSDIHLSRDLDRPHGESFEFTPLAY